MPTSFFAPTTVDNYEVAAAVKLAVQYLLYSSVCTVCTVLEPQLA